LTVRSIDPVYRASHVALAVALRFDDKMVCGVKK